jgi:hypothetical protein
MTRNLIVIQTKNLTVVEVILGLFFPWENGELRFYVHIFMQLAF